MTRPPFEDFLPDSGKVKNDEVRKRGLEGMKIAHEEGVKICYGSDLLVSMHALQVSLSSFHLFGRCSSGKHFNSPPSFVKAAGLTL